MGVELILQNKLREVEKEGLIWKIREKEKLGDPLSKLIKTMSDLNSLAKIHSITNELDYGKRFQVIYKIIGFNRKEN